jgi:hypothetical protein
MDRPAQENTSGSCEVKYGPPRAGDAVIKLEKSGTGQTTPASGAPLMRSQTMTTRSHGSFFLFCLRRS